MGFYIQTEDGWQEIPAYTVNHNQLEGVYRPEPIQSVLDQLLTRRDRFLAANGIQNMIEKQQHFRGDSFIEPLHGAFGEKL